MRVEFEPLNNIAGRESPIIFETVQFVQSQSIQSIDGKVTILPEQFILLQNYPNPFNPETWIPFKLAQNVPVSISIYSAKGQLIRTISLGNKQAGIYVTKNKATYWDGRDSKGFKVASGVYYYTLQAGEFIATRRMVIMKYNHRISKGKIRALFHAIMTTPHLVLRQAQRKKFRSAG